MACDESRAMNILTVHNAYQQRGGEDAVVDSEVALLRANGHSVTEYRRHNDELRDVSSAHERVKSNVETVINTLWSQRTTREVSALLDQVQPDIVHVHNTFPLISPSLHACVARAGVPLVQTLHNFRLACPQAMFLRDGRVCEDCLGKVPWRAVAHACYRGSRPQSAVVVGMLQLHRSLGTWQRHVARFLALSEFSRNKLVQTGLPAERISVLGQFVDDPWVGAPPSPAPRSGLLYVGRLAPEKGLGVLAQAVAIARQTRPDLGVDIIGTGPEQDRLQNQAGLRWRGAQTPQQVMQALQTARALVLPSLSFENFPRTLVEAFACGTPVITSQLGALAELVVHDHTGWQVPPSDAAALAQRLTWVDENASAAASCGAQARAHYLDHHTPRLHHAALLGVYGAVRQGRNK